MKILGIDPGYERVGIAVLEKPARNAFSIANAGGNKGDKKPFDKAQGKEKVLFSKCFKTSAKLEFNERLLLIGKEIRTIIKKFKPEILAIETLFLTTNQKTVMHVSEVRGIIIYEASLAGLKIFEASPPQIKIATTSYGRANKEQIMKMVKMLIKMDKLKTSDDELDAVAIALTAFAHHRG